MSDMWKRLEKSYKDNLGKAKSNYYKKEISKLKKSDQRKW